MGAYDAIPIGPGDVQEFDLYADGTSGQQGETSLAAEPHRRVLIPEALNMVARNGKHGITWAELAMQKQLHHGQASGALSNLHRTGRVVRLKERRGRCGVYVLPIYVDGRETVPHKSNKRRVNRDAEFKIEALLLELAQGNPGGDGHDGGAWQGCAQCALIRALRIVRGEE
jgi:hypothetical protein